MTSGFLANPGMAKTAALFMPVRRRKTMTRSRRWLLIPTLFAILPSLSSPALADQTRPAFIQAQAGAFLPAEHPVAQVVAQAGPKEEVLTNSDVLKMVRARLPESVILKKIRTGEARFDLSVNGLEKLKRAGASNAVIEAMMETEAPSKPAPRSEKAQTSPQPAPARPAKVDESSYFRDYQFAGKVGVGVQSSLLSFWLGPSLKYYLTDHIAVQGNLGVVGDFTTYGIRGIYQLNKMADVGGTPVYPYAGAGYSKITGPEVSYFGVTEAYEGSGFELLGGLLFDLTKSIGVPVHTSVELGYSNIELTASISYGGKKYDYTYDAWKGFLFGWNLFYNF